MDHDIDQLGAELAKLDRDDLERIVRGLLSNGVALSFHGKRTALEIYRRVRPRVMRREPKLHVGPSADQARNLLVEGENLQAMVTLHKYRGEVDLILTDPPYNTGQYFRYNDRWDNDPNDPELGTLVGKEDGSRHTKWIKAMMPRLQVMKAMLKPSGVLAICIDDNELYHLGMMLDEVFGEENRLGIINWQKAYSPKNDAKTVSKTTEYVLVYAKDRARAKTGRVGLDRGLVRNLDNDPDGDWIPSDPTARQNRDKTAYAIQSPVTGFLHYPNGEYRFDGSLPEARAHWVNFTKSDARRMLAEWGTEYVEKDLGDGRGKALILKGSTVALTDYDPQADPVVIEASVKAQLRREAGNWPMLYFRDDKARKPGRGRPRLKNHLHRIQEGKVPSTFWDEDYYADPLEIGSVSWAHAESGHTDLAKRELDAVVGKDHGFDTVKPLRLLKKIIQIWCPPEGLVMDPYAGSGSTGHAILELNHEDESNRRFILIEQGAPENGDKYARTLTWKRLANAITGTRPNGRDAQPLGGGFEYRLLTKTIDAKTVLSMQRNELIDIVLTSHWETQRRSAPSLSYFGDAGYQYLIGTDDAGEGYFLIWDNGGPVGSLDLETYKTVVTEGRRAGVKTPYHVYARYEMFQSPNVRFWKIPDRILAHLGLDENGEYNSAEQQD
ncbi:site-specific DNA-methyltransferase [Erythrobacter sp. T5W1-R]|uniref:site-specific DNA-methyltransferase n=1 Tax=Erythrobacter sp. T5W1-R TaxID=3101752 RepID=UPI002AFFC31E|nr:site-specific DNA-methyltransferase [Erythrobacter sp. T5W1-R]MEA1618317.1 site-specific DNA-methyltransferase [Erythrobacter sp. T5W1-R]